MKSFVIAAGLMALSAIPMALPVAAQTVIVSPAPEPPPPPPPSTVIVTPPPSPPVEHCQQTTTTTDRVIGSKTETTKDCVVTQGQ